MIKGAEESAQVKALNRAEVLVEVFELKAAANGRGGMIEFVQLFSTRDESR